jgi:GT2 family glycosyltransferase
MMRNEHAPLIANVRKMLLPAPPPFVQWLERMLRLLPSQFYPVQPLPVSDVKAINPDNGDYYATGNHPCFLLVAEPSQPAAGWYLLEAALVRHGGNRIAKLYVDIGRGYIEDDSIFIPSNRRGSISEVVYLPYGLKNVRWSPMESSGRFTQSALIFHRITGLESFFRRAWRVWDDWWRLRHLSLIEREGVSWYSPLVNLSAAYAWSADLRRANSSTTDYASCIQRNDTLTADDVIAINQHIPRLALKPVLSILMPVFNPPVDFFVAALDSVLAQHYPYWELCIADDASTDSHIREVIDAYVAKDNRIKAVFRPVNGHISAASNSALALATGEFVLLMDQDDVLPAHALYHVAVEINRYPDVALIYSDEDKIDELGYRSEPYFKSDWNPDLFYSQNMLSHLGVYRTSLVHELGGFRLGFEGSQDYDLALRCVARIPANRIRHIPRVLYHQRLYASESASPLQAGTDTTILASFQALQNHFADTTIKIETTEMAGLYRVRHPLPDQLPLVTLIIPTRDQVDVLRKCIKSLQSKTDYPNFEVLVLDNQSSDPATLKYLATLGKDNRFKVIQYDAPFNYSAINNYAVTLAQGEIIGLVNNDIEAIHADWLHEMVSHVLRPEVGAVGAKLLYSDGSIQHAGVILGLGGLAGHGHKYYQAENWGYCRRAKLTQTLSAVTAACLLVRKSVYKQVGGLDEVNLTVAYNDVDFCIKIREAGYRNIYTPYATLYHHESISRGQENTPEKQARFMREFTFMQKKWGNLLKTDPYYNPNLTQTTEDFGLGNHEVESPHHGYPLAI